MDLRYLLTYSRLGEMQLTYYFNIYSKFANCATLWDGFPVDVFYRTAYRGTIVVFI